MEKKKKRKVSPWKQLLISIIGTAIGVGLTFAVNNWMDNRKKEDAQRLMAIMVIHDIDESINTLKTLKEKMETMYNATMYAREHIDQLDSVPNDTLSLVLSFIVDNGEEFRFDNSKEKIFHSSPDTWQNLGCMKFIDNVQSCYYSRQTFQDMYNNATLWQRPVSIEVYEELNNGDNNLSLEEVLDQYYAKLRILLKEKLEDGHVKYYIDCTPSKLGSIASLIKYWIQVNDENKFLMSITDEELENYVNNINTNGFAVSEKSMIGTWEMSSTDEVNQFEFRKDHTYSYESVVTSPANLNFSQGKLKYIYKETGTWELKGDSLIAIPDSVDFETDASKMTIQPEKQEMLDNWVQNYQEEYLSYFQQKLKEDHLRQTWSVRLDASRDKMEMKKDKKTVYFKREKGGVKR
ncbi:MAG: hypothetical protein IKZ56_10360 [Bacteroidales bacterium]|nr:hypothetical protein [Bacteroidales bacterium]